jgi:hypothetical protein
MSDLFDEHGFCRLRAGDPVIVTEGPAASPHVRTARFPRGQGWWVDDGDPADPDVRTNGAQVAGVAPYSGLRPASSREAAELVSAVTASAMRFRAAAARPGAPTGTEAQATADVRALLGTLTGPMRAALVALAGGGLEPGTRTAAVQGLMRRGMVENSELTDKGRRALALIQIPETRPAGRKGRRA